MLSLPTSFESFEHIHSQLLTLYTIVIFLFIMLLEVVRNSESKQIYSDLGEHELSNLEGGY